MAARATIAPPAIHRRLADDFRRFGDRWRPNETSSSVDALPADGNRPNGDCPDQSPEEPTIAPGYARPCRPGTFALQRVSRAYSADDDCLPAVGNGARDGEAGDAVIGECNPHQLAVVDEQCCAAVRRPQHLQRVPGRGGPP